MRKHLNNYVRNVMFKDRRPPPSYRRRYYPRGKDLDYQIAKAKLANRLAKLDQENVDGLLDIWRKSPGDNFYFRKRGEVDFTAEAHINSSEDGDDGVDEDAEEDEDEDPEPNSEGGEQTLLFCCQTKQQKRLLRKYGNEICLLDATYKTIRYALPFFFLCVRTNVCYQVVGAFIIQYSTTEAIAEALKIFKSWNPSWNPPHFMTDFAEEEIHALEQVFKGNSSSFLIVHICPGYLCPVGKTIEQTTRFYCHYC